MVSHSSFAISPSHPFWSFFPSPLLLRESKDFFSSLFLAKTSPPLIRFYPPYSFAPNNTYFPLVTAVHHVVIVPPLCCPFLPANMFADNTLRGFSLGSRAPELQRLDADPGFARPGHPRFHFFSSIDLFRLSTNNFPMSRGPFAILLPSQPHDFLSRFHSTQFKPIAGARFLWYEILKPGPTSSPLFCFIVNPPRKPKRGARRHEIPAPQSSPNFAVITTFFPSCLYFSSSAPSRYHGFQYPRRLT